MPVLRRPFLFLVAATLFLPLIGTPVQAQDAGVYAFTDVTVIPMDRERILQGYTVVVRDGRIAAMGPSDEIRVPEGARRIDARGRYLLPGLAEMHAHVPPGDSPPRRDIEEVLFLYVANGITTIRGMLGSAYQIPLREEIRRGDILGPTFYVGAPSIRAATAATPEAAESLVRAHQRAGYDFLKIHPGVPRNAWDRMVQVANEVGISWGGHVPVDVGVYHAVRTGMTTVDHLDGFLEVTRRDGADQEDRAAFFRATDDGRLEELVRFLAAHRVWMVPTQYLWNNLLGYPDPDELLALPEFRYVSPQVRQAYRQRAEANRENPAITPESHEAHAEMRQTFLRAAHEAGVPILMGTDSPQLFNVPGFALHRELPLMLDAGMSPYEVLLSGTRNVADYVEEALGQPGDFGTVAPGMRADLILVEGNPLRSLDVLQEPAGVMVQGRWLSRDEIRAGLEAIAARYEGG
jgi:imidazolonepropionase-like amidohydrolase